MKSLLKYGGVLAVSVLLASPAVAAEHIVAGKVKSIDAGKTQFVLTDSADKEYKITLGKDVVVNRGGKEGKSNVKVDDTVDVFYDTGVLASTAKYILVREGDAKNSGLVRGTVKRYDGDKKELVFTDPDKKDWTFATAGAKVRLDKEDSQFTEVKIGDRALAIVDTVGDKVTLKTLMVHRK
jgi:hypothetical protein